MFQSVLIMRTYNSISALDFAIYFATGKAEKSAVLLCTGTHGYQYVLVPLTNCDTSECSFSLKPDYQYVLGQLTFSLYFYKWLPVCTCTPDDQCVSVLVHLTTSVCLYTIWLVWTYNCTLSACSYTLHQYVFVCLTASMYKYLLSVCTKVLYTRWAGSTTPYCQYVLFNLLPICTYTPYNQAIRGHIFTSIYSTPYL